MKEIQLRTTKKERLIWIGVTAILATALVIVTFSPRVFAQSEESEFESAFSTFFQVFKFVQNYFVDEDKVGTEPLLEGALKGLFESLDDPHSSYLSKNDMQDMGDTTKGRFGGVGMHISKVEKGIEVVSPIEDTPAYKSGINAGDIIIKVDGEETVEWTIDEAVNRLRGEPKSKVKVTILRGPSLVFDLTLTRDMIEVPTVKRAMIPGNIGYLRITQFTPLTAPRVEDAISFFEKEEYESLIIDVRYNPGGLLSSVIDVVDFFFADGLIVSTKSRVWIENAEYKAKKDIRVKEDIPIVVLINGGSASASEILAGAFKDRNRAYLIGDKSYGKGSVQQVRNISDWEGGFRLTISKYYTPSGVTIDKIGVEPHKVVKDTEYTDKEEASYLTLVEEELVEKFVKQNPSPKEKEIAKFLKELKEKGIVLRERHIRKMIRNEVNRTINTPPIYDLDYDLILQEAVKKLTPDQSQTSSGI